MFIFIVSAHLYYHQQLIWQLKLLLPLVQYIDALNQFNQAMKMLIIFYSRWLEPV